MVLRLGGGDEARHRHESWGTSGLSPGFPSGDDIERWILKTLCTHLVVTGKFGGDWEPPLEWLQILWGMKPFASHCGLYFNQKLGEVRPDVKKVAFRVLTSPSVAGASGAVVELGAYEFALALIPPDPKQSIDSALNPQYYRPSDFVVKCGQHEVVYAFGWNDPVLPIRVGISWEPKE
jgi:hypothetical protein